VRARLRDERAIVAVRFGDDDLARFAALLMG
jgi:hypothetical protein